MSEKKRPGPAAGAVNVDLARSTVVALPKRTVKALHTESPAVSPATRVKYRTTRSNVPAGGVFTVPVHVDAGSTVRYAFQTQPGDIVFGIRSVDDGGGFIKEVLPEERLAAHDTPVQGSFEAPVETRLVFVWDNSYSWLTDKSVVYNIEVLAKQPSATAVLDDTRTAVMSLQVDSERLASTVAELSNAQLELDRQIEALMTHRATVAASLAAASDALQASEEEADEARQALRGALFRTLPPSVHHLLFSFCGSEDLVRWRVVSKSWMTAPHDASFWAAESLKRFGAFDHNDVFKAAEEAKRGAVAADLFTIRAAQWRLTGDMSAVVYDADDVDDDEGEEEEEEEQYSGEDEEEDEEEEFEEEDTTEDEEGG